MNKKFCPQCHSKDVVYDDSTKLSGLYGLPERFKCRTCGFLGPVFPEIDKEGEKELEQEDKTETQSHLVKHEKVDTSYGKFMILYLPLLCGGLAFMVAYELWESYFTGAILLIIVGITNITLAAHLRYSNSKK